MRVAAALVLVAIALLGWRLEGWHVLENNAGLGAKPTESSVESRCGESKSDLPLVGSDLPLVGDVAAGGRGVVGQLAAKRSSHQAGEDAGVGSGRPAGGGGGIDRLGYSGEDGDGSPSLVRTEGGIASRSRGAGDGSYEPPVVKRGVVAQIGAGVRVSGPVEMGFTFRPDHYRGQAMRIANETNRALTVSLHGPGAKDALLNGQRVEEGRSYLVRSDVEIAGPASVGVHIRQPGGQEREACPDGVG